MYLQRLLKAFYDVKGIEVPKEVPESDQDELRHRFTAGLKVSEVKRLLTQQKAMVPFSDLAKTAKHYREATAIDTVSKNFEVLSIDRRDRSRGDARRDTRRFDSDRSYRRGYRDDHRGDRYQDRYSSSRGRFPSNERYFKSKDHRRERSTSFSRARSASRGRSESRGRSASREMRDGRLRSLSRGRPVHRDSVSSSESENERARSSSSERSYDRSDFPDRYNRSNSRGRRVTFESRMICHRCGTEGHIKRDCVASDRIVARYQRSRARRDFI